MLNITFNAPTLFNVPCLRMDAKTFMYAPVYEDLAEKLATEISTRLAFMNHGTITRHVGFNPDSGEDRRTEPLAVLGILTGENLRNALAVPELAELRGYTETMSGGLTVIINHLSEPVVNEGTDEELLVWVDTYMPGGKDGYGSQWDEDFLLKRLIELHDEPYIRRTLGSQNSTSDHRLRNISWRASRILMSKPSSPSVVGTTSPYLAYFRHMIEDLKMRVQNSD